MGVDDLPYVERGPHDPCTPLPVRALEGDPREQSHPQRLLRERLDDGPPAAPGALGLPVDKRLHPLG